MMEYLRFKIAIQTVKDNFRITIIITLLFMIMASMYAGMFPAFKEVLEDLIPGFSEGMGFIPGIEEMHTYVGFLNVEMYQIFWLLIMGILVGFIAATLISKEIEGKTIDLFLSTPISRKQIIFEKYVGLIPFVFIVNFATMVAVVGITLVINEDLNFSNLLLTHLVSIPYFLAVASVGLLISVIIDEKMKASIFMIALLVGMFIFRSISLMIPDYEYLGYISLSRYFNPYDTLIEGKMDVQGVIVLVVVILECLFVSMLYFDKRDIVVS